MSFKNYYKSCGLGLVLLFSALCAAARDGVAVVVDVVSYDKARAELNDYVKALEQKQGYKVYVVVDRWRCTHRSTMPLWALCLWVTSLCLWCATHSISLRPSRWIRR